MGLLAALALFDRISLPQAIRGGAAALVSWVAQTLPAAGAAVGHHGQPERAEDQPEEQG